MCTIFIFIIVFILFDKFRNILPHLLEIIILLNSFNNIYNTFMAVFDKIIIFLNIISYSFDGDL